MPYLLALAMDLMVRVQIYQSTDAILYGRCWYSLRNPGWQRMVDDGELKKVKMKMQREETRRRSEGVQDVNSMSCNGSARIVN